MPTEPDPPPNTHSLSVRQGGELRREETVGRGEPATEKRDRGDIRREERQRETCTHKMREARRREERRGERVAERPVTGVGQGACQIDPLQTGSAVDRLHRALSAHFAQRPSRRVLRAASTQLEKKGTVSEQESRPPPCGPNLALRPPARARGAADRPHPQYTRRTAVAAIRSLRTAMW